MKISGIYQIQSKVKPNRIYIGSSILINKRWKSHLNTLRKNNHGNGRLQNHFNKYGEADLQFSILLGCEKEDLLKVEQYFIDSYKPWFNISPTAGNTSGVIHSIQSRKNMSNAGKGKKHNYPKIRKPISQETIKKISESQKGRIFSEEQKRHISESKKGKFHKQLLRGWTGRKHTEETKLKMSKAKKGIKRGEYNKKAS